MSLVIDNKKMMRNTLALYFRMAFTMIVSFYTTRITLEVLGSEDYGLNNLVGGVVAMFSFISGSMGTAVQRFYSIEIGKKNFAKLRTQFGCGLYLHIIVAVIIFLLVDLFALFFLHKLNIPIERLDAAQVVFQFAMVSMIITIVNVPYVALLRAREEFTIIAVNDIIVAVLRLGIIYCLYVISYDKLILFAFLNFLITLASVLFLTIRTRSYQEARCFISRDKTIIKDMLSFVSLLLLTVLASVFREKGMILLINLFFGLTINAAFAIAFQVTMMVSTFVMNFKQAVVPQLMAAWGAGDIASVHKLIDLGTKITFILMLMISVPIIFESDYLMKLWLETPPQYTSNLVVLGLISINISSFTYFHYQAVHATGQIKSQQMAMSLSYILNIILIYVMFELGYSFYYCYYITIGISVLQCAINLYFSAKYISYSLIVFIKTILVPCLLTCSFVFLILNNVLIFFVESNFYKLILVSLLSTLLLVFISYNIILAKHEKELVKTWIKNKINVITS